MMQSLPSGYAAVVFGATGGIGRALVDRLEADPRCATVVSLHRGSAPPLELTDEAGIAAAAAAVRERLDEAHLLIDATGILAPDGRRPEKRLAEIDPAAMARQFAINATGPALLLKHFADLLPRRARGIFATLSARVGSIEDNRRGGWIGYRSAKAALNQVVRTAAIELHWRRPGSVCVALQPGTVATALSAPFRRDDSGVLEPDEAARRLLAVLDGLDTDDSGGLFDHAGERIPG